MNPEVGLVTANGIPETAFRGINFSDSEDLAPPRLVQGDKARFLKSGGLQMGREPT